MVYMYIMTIISSEIYLSVDITAINVSLSNVMYGIDLWCCSNRTSLQNVI